MDEQVVALLLLSSSAQRKIWLAVRNALGKIIEQRGKDPKTAARIALERLLKQGRDPFETQIFLNVPYGHAEYFSKNEITKRCRR